jgi:acyl transferase domain-containing protein
MSKETPEPVAIVGMSCRLPGADTLDAYWRMLVEGRHAITAVPKERWDNDDLYDETGVVQGKVASAKAGFVDARRFDYRFFGISHREAPQVDPQQLLLLELAWQALEDAHIPHPRLRRSQTGVFVGATTVEAVTFFLAPTTMSVYSVTGLTLSMLANRISSFFDARGPSVVVESACSASLSAIHAAVRSVRSGESELALAGGINLWIIPHHFVALSQMGVVAPNGECRPFDAAAQGMVASEGAAMLVLKRLADAERDGDRIYAVLYGSAVNQDGKSEGMARPIEEAKEQVVRLALADALIDPARVGYVETHGTGTPLGDQIEARSLGAIFGKSGALIGSVKANIGHLQASAGVASVVKVGLGMRANVLPKTIHHREPSLDLGALGLSVATDNQAWPRRGLTGVSSFGIGGSNAHVIMGPAPTRAEQAGPARAERPLILPLSARDTQALRTLRDAYAERLGAEPDPALLCDETIGSRGGLDERMVAIGDDVPALVRSLANAKTVSRKQRGSASVAFVFAGHGPDWSRLRAAMPKDLPAFADTLQRALAFVQQESGLDVLADNKRTRALQPAICAYQIALCELWRAVGIEPRAVIGHSVGEIAAAYTAGVLSFEDALRLAIRRGAILDDLRGKGNLFAAAISIEDARQIVASMPGTWIAAHNGPKQTVLGVSSERAVELSSHLVDASIPFTPLANEYPFHGPAVQPLASALTAAAGDLSAHAPKLPWISTLTGERVHDVPAPHYWADEAAQPVAFDKAVGAAIELGIDVFFEIAPAATLTRPIAQKVLGRRAAAVSMLHGVRAADFWQGAADLWAHHASLDWSRLMHVRRAPWLPLPAYPFQRTRGWNLPPLDRLMQPVGRLRLEQQPVYLERLQEVALPPPLAGAAPTLVYAHPQPKLAAAMKKLLGKSEPTNERCILVLDATRANAAEKLVQATARITASERAVIAIVNGARDERGAGLVAMARSLRLEHKQTSIGIVVLDAAKSLEQAAVILGVLADRSGEVVWEQRGEILHVPRLERATPQSVMPLVCSPGAAYCITGGLGGLGLGLAEHLIVRGARHVLLLSRRKLPDRARWAKVRKKDRAVIDRIVALEKMGASVEIASIDVGDAAQVTKLFRARAAACSPPVRGIIHGAGVGVSTSFAKIRAHELREQWRTKVEGLAHLVRACPRADFVIALSSLAAATGTAREASYARANAGMDALARKLNAAGSNTVSVRLGPVAGLGLAARTGKNTRLAAIGHTPLDFDHVCVAIDRAVDGDDPVVLATDTDWPTFAPFIADRAYLNALLPDTTTAFAEPQTEAEIAIAKLWCRILRLDSLSLHDSVFERGATSISVLRFVTEAGRLGLHYPPEEIWTRTTVEAQARYLEARAAPVATR